MDNLTHTLAGAALGEAGLKRLSRLAMPALMIGANLPDVDVIAIPLGENLTFRRGWTHGPIAILLLPVVLTLLLLGWDRLRSPRDARAEPRPPVRPRQLLLLSAVGVLSHPFLDWLNSYGIRLLMPLREKWFYGDSIFIIDPWIWITLGVGVHLSRRRARRGARGATRPSRAALGAVGAYILAMILGTQAAREIALRHIAPIERREPERLMAGPVPLHPLRRELIYDMGEHYRLGSLSWTPRPVVTLDPAPLPTLLDHPAALSARAHEPVRDFLSWSRFPYFVVETSGDHSTVLLRDARFSGRAASWSTVSVRVLRPSGSP